jgi:hypothetical protein
MKYQFPKTDKKIDSTSLTLIKKFIQVLENQQVIPQLYERIKKLDQLHSYQSSNLNELESIDQTFTSTLLKAEKLVAPPSSFSWSPELLNLNKIYRYWQISNKGNSLDNWKTSILLRFKILIKAILHAETRNNFN